MDNSIREDIKKIEENKNLMLGYYKDLIVCYEENRELYEDIIKSMLTPVECSKVIAYNDSYTVTQWALYSLEGKRLYISGYHKINDDCIIDLSKIGIAKGTQFTLKAIVKAGDDSSCNTVMEYNPDSIMSAKFKLTGSLFNTTLTYIGVID